jgi:hypothetical protein
MHPHGADSHVPIWASQRCKAPFQPHIQPLQEPKSIWSDLAHKIKHILGDKFVSGYKIQASRSARRGAKQLSGCAKEWCAVVKVHDCRKIAAFRFDWKRGEATFPMCQRTVGRRGSPRLLEEVQSNIPAGPEEVQSNCRLH